MRASSDLCATTTLAEKASGGASLSAYTVDSQDNNLENAGLPFAPWLRRNPPGMPACRSGMLLTRTQNSSRQMVQFGRKPPSNPDGTKIAFIVSDPLDEAVRRPGSCYFIHFFDGKEVTSLNIPFIPGGPMSWVE